MKCFKLFNWEAAAARRAALRCPIIAPERFLALCAIGVCFALGAKLQQSLPRLVGSEGSRVRMLVAGSHGPTVVLESFGAMRLDFWGTIQWRCAKFCRVVSYDHLGTGGSDPGGKPRDAMRIARELHSALRAANLPGPYLLVGYSFGGPYVRVFSSLYPREVAALVLIDPTQEEMFDWLKVHRPDLNRPSAEDDAEENEFASTWRSLEQARSATLPNVPVTLVTAMKPFGEMDPRLRPQWLAAHERWVRQVPEAKHLVTERSDHGIIWEDPDLVVRTIRDMVNRISIQTSRSK